jgi:hypothetical protein
MKIPAIASVVLLVTQTVGAYEIDTHSRITYEAFRKSVFESNSILYLRLGLAKARTRLQIDPSTIAPNFHLGIKYYDPTKVDGPDRYATTYDRLNSWVMKQYNASEPLPRWAYSQFDARAEPYFPVDWMACALWQALTRTDKQERGLQT